MTDHDSMTRAEDKTALAAGVLNLIRSGTSGSEEGPEPS